MWMAKIPLFNPDGKNNIGGEGGFCLRYEYDWRMK